MTFSRVFLTCAATLFCSISPGQDAFSRPLPKLKDTSMLSHGPKVLWVGDSLTVGPFGEAVESSLIETLGRGRVWMFAACGSSVESWLESEPAYVTACGYRECTPTTRVLEDYHANYHPQRMPAPKVEALLKKIEPDIIIVQLGTNHFDALEHDGKGVLDRQSEVFERFSNTLWTTTEGVRQVIWIMPPDSARFADWIQTAVAEMIQKAAKRHHYQVIDSRKYTHYTKGVSGGDGVHYWTDQGYQWAANVLKELTPMLRR